MRRLALRLGNQTTGVDLIGLEALARRRRDAYCTVNFECSRALFRGSQMYSNTCYVIVFTFVLSIFFDLH